RGDHIIDNVGHHDPEQAADECVFVHPNVTATRSVRVEPENIVTAGVVGSGWTVCRLPDVHCEGRRRTWSQQGMRVRFHVVKELGPLDCVGKLGWVGAARVDGVREYW